MDKKGYNCSQLHQCPMTLYDQISAINDIPTDDFNYDEAGYLIQKCIDTKELRLKVSRRCAFPTQGSIRDVYYVVAEDSARSQLARVAASFSVTPIDISPRPPHSHTPDSPTSPSRPLAAQHDTEQAGASTPLKHNNSARTQRENNATCTRISALRSEHQCRELSSDNTTPHLDNQDKIHTAQINALVLNEHDTRVSGVKQKAVTNTDSDCCVESDTCRIKTENKSQNSSNISICLDLKKDKVNNTKPSGELILNAASLLESSLPKSKRKQTAVEINTHITTSLTRKDNPSQVVNESELTNRNREICVASGGDRMEMTVLSKNPTSAPHQHALGGAYDNTALAGSYDNPALGGYADPGSFDSLDSVDEIDLPDRPQHREMAIDVPANFVGVKKEPPRYPAHLHGYQSANSSAPSTPSHKSSQSGKKTKPPGQNAPSNEMPAHMSRDGQASANDTHPHISRDNQSSANETPPRMSRDEEVENQARIVKYQEELRKRREQEESFQREQEFLRNSLRDSQKLRDLQENGAALKAQNASMAGFTNPNYLIEEEEGVSLEGASRSSTLPVRKQPEGADRPSMDADQISALLARIQSRLRSAEEVKAVSSVQAYFDDPRFLQTLYIHNKVVEASLRNPAPAHSNAQGLVTEVLQHVPAGTSDIFVQELRRLLQKTHFTHLLRAHDAVAQSREPQSKQQPHSPAHAHQNGRVAGHVTEPSGAERDYLYERVSQYGEESIKVVRLQKTADPLGATVRNEGESVVIGRIVKGGAAEKSGLLHEGDEILEINGTDVRHKTIDDVCDLMAALTGTLTFLIVPSQEYSNTTPSEKVLHFKAHFDYDPEEDPYIPCRELGIMFRKSDILHVINMSDPSWWQAYREGEDDQNLAGLVPSRTFQEQKESLMMTLAGSDKHKKSGGMCMCACRPSKSKKKKKKHMYGAAGEDVEEEILTYEEVAQYYPQPNRKRPIVMIGPPNVGRQELRQRLMESDVERFAAAIPHTSRQRKDAESDAVDYHFVTRQAFEHDITQHKFAEYGEYEKNLYGTSLESIRSVVNTSKICVLNLQPQSLRILKESDLKPYVVFIAPPNLEKLRQLRLKQDSVNVSDEELHGIIEKAREMEENFGQYFDFIIMNYDTNRAYEDLLKEINRLEVEPQWVPAQWVS